MASQSLPPFPSDLPTAGLVSVPLHALESSPPSSDECSKLFTASRELGFFYLDLIGSELGESILCEVERLYALQQEFYALPHEVKDQYGMDKIDDPFYSYRWTQCKEGVKDVWGRSGRREMYNIRVDDVLKVKSSLPKHATISAAEPIFLSFALHCRQVVQLLLSIIETQLLLPPGSLLNLHRHGIPCGDFISLQHRAFEPVDPDSAKQGEHTDFGSITMLFNWLGGLQIREQFDADTVGDWVYVKPIPGSCVINLADSLVKLTAGVLKSNIHRVVPPPGSQAGLPRYSLVYFAHANDDVILKPVKGGMVDHVYKDNSGADGQFITAADWVVRRSLGDLRGVYTYKGGIELRELNDAVAVQSVSQSVE